MNHTDNYNKDKLDEYNAKKEKEDRYPIWMIILDIIVELLWWGEP